MEIKHLFRFTINVRKSHRHTQRTLHLVCKDRVLFVGEDRHVVVCGERHQNSERAIRVVYPPFFCRRRSSSNLTKQI
jgi:hypothetical protein